MTPSQLEERRKYWLEKHVDVWASIHGISREQALSVLFADNVPDGVHAKDLYWADCNEMAGLSMKELGLKPWSPLGTQKMRADREIVDQTNALARDFCRAMGYSVPDGFRFDKATHPTELLCWTMACRAQQILTQTDPEDALQGESP